MGLETPTYINDLVETNPVGSTDPKSQGDDHIRNIKAVLKTTFPGFIKPVRLQQPFVDEASGASTDIGAALSDNVRITGSTTITSFGTAAAGVVRHLRFASALVLTHNSGSLILPTGANITTATDDYAFAISLGSGNWYIPIYSRKSGKAIVASTFAEAGLISALTELTAPALDDVLIVGDTSASGASRYMSLTNFLKTFVLAPTETTFAPASDFLFMQDTSEGAFNKILGDNVRVGEAALADLAPGSLLLAVEEQRAAGNSAGGIASGSFVTRNLGTTIYNRLGYTTAAASFTLPAGDFEIFFDAPGYNVGAHICRLWNTTAGAVQRNGSTEQAFGTQTRSWGIVRVSLGAAAAFRIEHRVEATNAVDGLGRESGLTTESYARAIVRRG